MLPEINEHLNTDGDMQFHTCARFCSHLSHWYQTLARGYHLAEPQASLWSELTLLSLCPQGMGPLALWAPLTTRMGPPWLTQTKRNASQRVQLLL